jgi:hypothetical protein
MLVAAGRDHSGTLDDVHLLDLKTLTWSLLGSQPSPACMPSRVCNHLAAAIESAPSSKLFVFGGQAQERDRRSWAYIDQIRSAPRPIIHIIGRYKLEPLLMSARASPLPQHARLRHLRLDTHRRFRPAPSGAGGGCLGVRPQVGAACALRRVG